MDELELYVSLSYHLNPMVIQCCRYLPSFPYQDNPTFHIYAGLTSLYLAQPTSGLECPVKLLYYCCLNSLLASTLDSILLRQAQTHFDHAKALDPDNDLPQAFLEKVCKRKMTTRFELICES